ncbi:MAG: hypothetical protein GJ676_20250 [Rhodobacteraceae bacterium]|nr:hypothetical protein [Paracoccaceae bacterium]
MKDLKTDLATRDVIFPSGPNTLHGTLYEPHSAPRAALVLNSATGVPQGYYRAFATWLAQERSIACLTYDYSGFERSAAPHPKASKATMADWALVDQPAARTEMRRLLPGVPLWVLGHSVGAMLMPLQDGLEDVQNMIGVASGLVHHSDHPWPYQALARSFWFGHVPVMVKLLGYLPGKLVGFGADLPAGVYWQWRLWCTTKNAYLDEMGKTLPQADWSRSGAPVTLNAFTDDSTIPPKCTQRLAEVYGGSDVSVRIIDPVEHGLQQVGHLGAFTRRNARLWPELVPTF